MFVRLFYVQAYHTSYTLCSDEDLSKISVNLLYR